MRIGISALPLEVKNAYGKAGVNRFTYNLINALLAIDCPHEFVMYVGENYQVPDHWRANPRLTVKPVSSKLRKIRSLWNMFEAIPLAKKDRLDVWFGTNLAVPLWSAAPRVMVVHDLFPITHPEWFAKRDAFMFSTALRISTRRAERLLSISEYTKRELGRLLQIPADRVSVIPLGPGNSGAVSNPLPLTVEERTRLQLPFEKVFLCVGTMEPRKNLSGLARSVGIVADELREQKAGVVMVGAKGWKDSGFYSEIQRLGIEDLIHFMGYVEDEDLVRLYSGSEALLFPSLDEGFGLPALEAQLFGTIPICSNRGSIPEVAGPGAILVPVEEPEAFAKAMLQALDLPDRAERITANHEFIKQFTWDRAAQIALSTFESVAEKR